MLLPVCNAFANGTDHITGFADTDADLTFFIADNNDGPEAHLLAALDGLGNAADLDHPFLPLGVTLLSATIAAATTAVAAITASAALLLLLTFSCRWDVSGARNGIWIGFGRGIGHGLAGIRIEGPLPGRRRQGL